MVGVAVGGDQRADPASIDLGEQPSRIIGGIELPSSGSLHLGMSLSWPLALQGAFVGGLTGLDNLRFVCRIYGIDYKQAMPFIADFSGLGRYLREPIRSYSSGMRSRLAFAISMAVNFDCYLIDEVTAVGDKSFSDKCRDMLVEGKRGCALILVSHVPGILQEYCTRYSVLDRGCLSVYESYSDADLHYNEILSRQTPML